MKVLLMSLQRGLEAIGLKYLHYYLLENGHQSSILYLPNLNLNDFRQRDNIKEFIFSANPGLIGISLMSDGYYLACSLTKYLRGFNSSIPIIWGGVHPTISPDNCLEYADYVCRGEGEKTILDIANAISKSEDIKNINNLCYSEGGFINKNPLYPLLDNLDEMPICEHIPRNSFIMRNGNILELDKKVFRRYDRYMGRIYSAITTRGCPFSCTYCCNNSFSLLYDSNKARKRSISNIIEELEKTLKDNQEIEYVNFQDDCFLAYSDEYLRQFCEIYKEKIGKPFITRVIPVYITKDKIKSLKEAGLSWVSLGLQSGSDRICKEIYKRKSFKADFLKAARIIKDFNLAAFYDVIFDNPFESEEDKFETIDTLIKTPRPFYMQCFSLVLYPGTELYEKAKLEYPGCVEDYLEKDYSMPHQNAINDLIRLAPFIDKKFMTEIIRLYKRQSQGRRFKTILFITKLLTVCIFQPVAYFQVVRLSQRGSYLKTFKVLAIYFKEGFRWHFNQFRGKVKDAQINGLAVSKTLKEREYGYERYRN